MSRTYTASEIAEITSDAASLRGEGRKDQAHRTRYCAKRGLLKDGSVIDKRGTLVFPVLEVFRAAALVELQRCGIESASVATALNRVPDLLPSAVEGVAAGKQQTLVLRLMRPGSVVGSGALEAAVVSGAADQSPIYSSGKKALSVAAVVVNLNALIEPILTRLSVED